MKIEIENKTKLKSPYAIGTMFRGTATGFLYIVTVNQKAFCPETGITYDNATLGASVMLPVGSVVRLTQD